MCPLEFDSWMARIQALRLACTTGGIANQKWETGNFFRWNLRCPILVFILANNSSLSSPRKGYLVQISCKPKSKRGIGEGAAKHKKEKEEPVTAPELVVKPRRQFTDEGADAKFKCSFDGPKTTALFWTKDGVVLSADRRHKIYESDGFHYLEVIQVVGEDTGVYAVTVQNSAGSDNASAELEVFVKPKLLSKSEAEWEQPLTDITVHLGDVGVTLTCVSKNLTKPTAKWFHYDKELFSGFHVKLTHEAQRASLTFKDIRSSDAGHLKCTMAGSNAQLETSCILSVASDSEDEMKPPVFLRELHDQEAQEGDRMVLEVEVKGSQPIEVFWFHNNVEITYNSSHFLLASHGSVHTLTVPCVTSDSSGEYVCEAYNDWGDTDTFCLVEVQEVEHPEAPDFLTHTMTRNVNEGQSVTFKCQVKGHPLPSVVWEKDGVRLSSDDKYKMTQIKDQHTLTINNAGQADAGPYKCHLLNKVGETSAVCVLKIRPVTTQTTSETLKNRQIEPAF
ncbi:hypothetical protein Btru_047901 [Bulinus truncatus]|nr:hypothetical protein Btru_047901 [Bulinus truncatus]